MTTPAERYRLPISVKAALVDGDRVCLLLNERDQWELPGGRLEAGESPEACLAREVREELGFDVSVDALVDARFFQPTPEKQIFVVLYRCRRLSDADPVLSDEHREVGWFSLEEAASMTLPEGTLPSLRKALDTRS